MAKMKPALSLSQVSGRGAETIELVKAIEQHKFSGTYVPNMGNSMGLCEALAVVTSEIRFGSCISPIYYRHVLDYASTVTSIHDVSNGRFTIGIGVSHNRVLQMRNLEVGKPLEDIKQNPNFFVGNMIPTCVSEDEEKAKGMMSQWLSSATALLFFYRNYWKQSGYPEEMRAIEEATDERETHKTASFLSDDFLSDTTLCGTSSQVLDSLEMWYEAGIKTPILAPIVLKEDQRIDTYQRLIQIFQ